MLNDDGGAVLMDFGSVMEGHCKISSRNQALAMQVWPFMKGESFAVWKRGKFDFDRAILRFWPSSLNDRTFCLMASFRLVESTYHFKKKSSKKVVKLGSEILYLFFAEKWSSFVLFCLFVCCNTLSDFGLLEKNWSFNRAEKDAGLGITQPLFADLLELQRYNFNLIS